MILNIRELESRKIRFDQSYPPGEIEILDGGLKQVSPLRVEGAAELVSRSLGEVRIQGRLSVRMEADCDRCLEPAGMDIDAGFDLFYEPASNIARSGEVEIGERETDIGFYEGEELDLREILRERVLLALPMQHVCRDGCRGICPVCGQNRNRTECACQTQRADDRWAGLKNL